MTGIIGKISSRSKIVNEPLTDGGILLGSGADAITATAVLANSEMLVGDGTTDPAIESGATLRTSIGIGTGDSPTFAVPNLTGTLATGVQDNITRLGTVTVGNLSNTAIVYPTGHVIGSHTAINLSYAASTSGSAGSPSWVDGVTIDYTPQSGSKILLLVDAWIGSNGLASYGMSRLTKTPAGGSMVELRCGTTSSYKQLQMSSAGDVWQLQNVGGSAWDVHGQDGSTEITYRMQCARQGGSNVYMGRPYDDPTGTAGSSAATQISILEIK